MCVRRDPSDGSASIHSQSVNQGQRGAAGADTTANPAGQYSLSWTRTQKIIEEWLEEKEEHTTSDAAVEREESTINRLEFRSSSGDLLATLVLLPSPMSTISHGLRSSHLWEGAITSG